MTVLIHRSNNELLLRLPAEFDALSVQQMRPVLDEIVSEDASKVELDFDDVVFIDSSGIGAIVFLYKRLKSKGVELALRHVAGQPLRLLQDLRVDMVIPVIPGSTKSSSESAA
jgi:anti-anti-sigma factor